MTFSFEALSPSCWPLQVTFLQAKTISKYGVKRNWASNMRLSGWPLCTISHNHFTNSSEAMQMCRKQLKQSIKYHFIGKLQTLLKHQLVEIKVS